MWISRGAENISATGLRHSAASLLPRESVVVTTRATIGATALTVQPLATNQGFKNIIPSADFDPVFVYFLVRSLRNELLRRASGSTFVEISRRDFRSISVEVPPRPEQERVAAVLSSAHESLVRSNQVLRKLRSLRRGLVRDLATFGVREDGVIRRPDEYPRAFVEGPLGPMPKEWEAVTIGAIVRRSGGLLQTGPFGSQLHSDEYVQDGVPVVMPQDINDAQISTSRIARVTAVKAARLGRHRVQPNDVLFARRGELERAAAINRTQQGWLCGTGCLLLRVSSREVAGPWLAAMYADDLYQRQIRANAVGTTMVNLNVKVLESMLVLLPSPPEQLRIVACLESTGRRIAAEFDNLQKLRELGDGLSADLLSGRVRTIGITT